MRKKKIEVFAHIAPEHIIAAPDISVVYELPLLLEQQQLGYKLLNHFRCSSKKFPVWDSWKRRVESIKNPTKKVTIAVVGKYLDIGDFSLTDSYLSVCHSLLHAVAHYDSGIDIQWIDAKQFEQHPETLSILNNYDGLGRTRRIWRIGC